MRQCITRRLRRVLRRTDRRLRTARTPDETIAAFERFTVEIAALNERDRRRRSQDHSYLRLTSKEPATAQVRVGPAKRRSSRRDADGAVKGQQRGRRRERSGTSGEATGSGGRGP